MYGNAAFDEAGRRQRLEDVTARGAPEREAGMRRGDVRDLHGSVLGSVLSDPGEIVLAEGRAGDDPESVPASRVTVKSHSMPPRSFSIWV